MVGSARTFSGDVRRARGMVGARRQREFPSSNARTAAPAVCKHQVLVGEQEWRLIHSWMRQNLTKEHRQQIVGRVHAQMEQPGNPLRRWLGMGSKTPRVFVRAVGRGFKNGGDSLPDAGATTTGARSTLSGPSCAAPTAGQSSAAAPECSARSSWVGCGKSRKPVRT